MQLLLHIVTVVCSNIPSDGTVDRFADDHPRQQTIKASVRQYITERPSLEEDSERVEYATAAEPAGTISTTGEPNSKAGFPKPPKQSASCWMPKTNGSSYALPKRS